MRATPAHRALVLILVLGGALRFPGLGTVPPSLHPDEAANAADSLSLLEHPGLTFHHEQGGWVEGPYVWLSAPFLLVAAKTDQSLERAARLPAALAGWLLLPLVYLLGTRLAGPTCGLLAALVVAVSPWGFHLSRLALRASLVPLLITGGLYLAGAGRRSSFWGGVLLALAGLTYPPARLLAPLLGALTLATRRVDRRQWILTLAPPLGVLLVLLPWTLAGAGAERLEQLSVVDPQASPAQNAYSVLRGYALHYTPRALFSGSSSRGFAPEGHGLLPLLSAPLLVVGLATCLRSDRPGDRLLLGWVLCFPLAAALTSDVPNPLRAVAGLPALGLLTARGGQRVLSLLPSAARRAAWSALAGGLLAAGLCQGARYHHLYPHAQAEFYYPGRRELARAAAQLARRGETVLVRAPFVSAYLRLYAPGLPLRQSERGWVLGPGSARLVLRPLLPGEQLRQGERPGPGGAVASRAIR